MKNRRWIKFFGLLFASLLVFTSCNNANYVKNLDLGSGKQVIVLGDSIAAGYGVKETEGFVSLLSRQLGLPIVNRSVSGDTTAMGLSRWQKDAIALEPWLVIVELGTNDYLQKIPKAETEKNLRRIVASIQQQKAIVVLLGINQGLVEDEYKEIYEGVAKDTQSFLIPQVFKEILDVDKYRLDDVHPNPVGHQLLAARIAKDLQPLLARATWPDALLQFRQKTK